MRIIAEGECRSWLAGAERQYPSTATWPLPADAGRKTALARTLTAHLDTRGEGLLWITEWGVFPSSENMALFEGYRRSLHEERPLHAAPGHVFTSSDMREVECLLDLVLYFFWDASIYDVGGTWLRFSHDEVFSVNASDDALLGRWRERMAAFGLEEL